MALQHSLAFAIEQVSTNPIVQEKNNKRRGVSYPVAAFHIRTLVSRSAGGYSVAVKGNGINLTVVPLESVEAASLRDAPYLGGGIVAA